MNNRRTFIRACAIAIATVAATIYAPSLLAITEVEDQPTHQWVRFAFIYDGNGKIVKASTRYIGLTRNRAYDS